MEAKKCRGCKQSKLISEFSKKPTSKDGYHNFCKRCINDKRNVYRKAHPEKMKAEKLDRTFGISLYRYKAMLVEQDGVCAICGRPETSTYKGKLRHLAVDHDHETNKVRGLLCNDCNIALGWFHDDVQVLRIAAKYLSLHKM